MSQTSTICHKLITQFTEHYMEKLFYYCLKRTGSSDEAENLTQDIALNVISALSKGTIPTHFSAWVWQIAHNRYCVWADKKHKHAESITGSDISDYELADESLSILDEMIHSEQLSLLRRELAFINSDYRDIIVAYYIENRGVRDIAKTLSLSTDAVKKRLQRARITLKEGMNMAREFGTRSYQPETINFAASGSQPSGLPWTAVQRSIPKNILLQASNNPSTVEELSMELGIALPYMEEEVDLLHKATLLEKSGDKYITNFFILSKECLLDIYNALRSGSKERSRLLQELLTDNISDIRALGIAGEQIDNNAMFWWLVPHCIDYFIRQAAISSEEKSCEPPIRANGESWGFVGYETVVLPEAITMSHDGCGNDNYRFWQYRFSDYSLWNQCYNPTYEEILLLGSCITENRNLASFTTHESEYWNNINGKIAHTDEDGNIIPDILIMTENDLEKLHEMLQKHKKFPLLLSLFEDAYEKLKNIFKGYHHKILHDYLGYNIVMELYDTRMMSVHDLVETGFLKLPENPAKSSLGMHIILQ